VGNPRYGFSGDPETLRGLRKTPSIIKRLPLPRRQGGSSSAWFAAAVETILT